MKRIASFVLALAMVGCTTYQAHSNLSGPVAPTAASSVKVLYSPPQQAYESIGIVSAKRYKPGWSDPTVSDAIPQLQAAGAQIGADAVIVRSDRSQNTRSITVEAEAIRYVEATTESARPAGTPQQGDMKWRPKGQ